MGRIAFARLILSFPEYFMLTMIGRKAHYLHFGAVTLTSHVGTFVLY